VKKTVHWSSFSYIYRWIKTEIMSYKYLTVAFLIINFLASLLLWHIIYKHISTKPILSVSLVDLIYRDIVIYIISLSLIISTGIIHTLMYSEDFNLAFEFALLLQLTSQALQYILPLSLVLDCGYYPWLKIQKLQVRLSKIPAFKKW